MAEAPKTPTASELSHAASIDLERLLKAGSIQVPYINTPAAVGGMTPEQRTQAIEGLVAKTKSVLEKGLGEHVKGDAALHITQDHANEIAQGVARTLADRGHAHYNAAERAALEGIGDTVRNKVDEAQAAAIKKMASDGDKLHTLFGGAQGGYAAGVMDSMNLHSQNISNEIRDKHTSGVQAELKKRGDDLTKMAELTQKVGADKIRAMHAPATDFVHNHLKKAIDARHAHTMKQAEFNAAAKGGALTDDQKTTLEGLNKTALEHEEAAAKRFTEIRKDMKGDELLAHDRVIQAKIDGSRATHKDMHANLQRILEEKGDMSKLGGDLTTKLTTDSHKAFAGVETSTTRSLMEAGAKEIGGAATKWGKIGMGAAGVALAGGAVYNALKDKPADPQTNEKPKMSFMGKVATALAAVVGVGMVVMAVKGRGLSDIKAGWEAGASKGGKWAQLVEAGRGAVGTPSRG